MGMMQLMAKLGLDATSFETGLKRSKSSAQGFADDLVSQVGSKITGLFGVAAIEEGFRRAIEYASKIQDLTVRTGISTDDLQRIDFAAQQTGSSIEAMVMGIEKFAIAQSKAAKGGPGNEQFEAMRRLGISPEQISNLDDYVKNFFQAGQTIHDTALNAQSLADITTVMGKSARELIPAFKEGFTEQADKAPIIDAAAIAQLDAFGDEMKSIWAFVRMLLADIAASFIYLPKLVGAFIVALWDAGKALVTLSNPLKAFQETFEGGLMEKGPAAVKKTTAASAAEVAAAEAEKVAAAAKTTAEQQAHAAAEKKETADIGKVQEQIDKLHQKFSGQGLTDQEKIAALEERISAAKKAREDAFFSGAGMLDLKKKELDIAMLEDERGKLTDRRKSKDISLRGGHDALLAIGNFLGVDPNRGVVDKLDIVNVTLKEIAKNTRGELKSDGIEFPAN